MELCGEDNDGQSQPAFTTLAKKLPAAVQIVMYQTIQTTLVFNCLCDQTSCSILNMLPLLRQLHWLPVQRRVEFKIACLVHQSLVHLHRPT